MINFNSLPQDNPMGGTIDPGCYVATIEKAEMKQGKDPQKPPYLSLQYGLADSERKNKGKLFDLLVESDHQVVRYKIQRFITALGIPITGNFELKDLCKIVQGKKMIVDVTLDKKQEPARPTVDVFSGAIYYPIEMYNDIFGPAPQAETVEEYFGGIAPINATDATDASLTPATEY